MATSIAVTSTQPERRHGLPAGVARDQSDDAEHEDPVCHRTLENHCSDEREDEREPHEVLKSGWLGPPVAYCDRELFVERWRGRAHRGVRFFGERLSADLGLAVPLGAGELFAFPVVNFVYVF